MVKWSGCVFLLFPPILTALQIQDGAVHFEPMVAMLCPSTDVPGEEQYYNKFLSPGGNWLTDTSGTRSTCNRDKVAVLEFCQKVYPERDITNIVESSKSVQLAGWCKVGQLDRCESAARWVKPYRCLEGQFQSDALLVPEGCLFDHVHNQSLCMSYDEWNATAGDSCSARGPDMVVRNVGMLLPCGVDMFSGVEFVCCQNSVAQSKAPKDLLKDSIQEFLRPTTQPSVIVRSVEGSMGELVFPTESRPLDEEYYMDEEETYYEEEMDDDYNSNNEDYTREEYVDTESFNHQDNSPTSTTVPTSTEENPTTFEDVTTEKLARDPYFTHYDPKREHAAFIEAERRIDTTHSEKVARIMRDWAVLQEKYQEMKLKDPAGAETLKEGMNDRLQKTIQDLEEENMALKRQLRAMHQQRVLNRLNAKKKEAETCYADALESSLKNIHRVKKCLMSLLKSLHKERAHTLDRFRQTVEADLEAAVKEKEATLDHLAVIDARINESLTMLYPHPTLKRKVLSVMENYLANMRRKDNTPSPYLIMDRDREVELLNGIIRAQQINIENLNKQQAYTQQQKVEVDENEVATEETTTMPEPTVPAEQERVAGPLKIEVENDDLAGAEIQVEVHATAVHHDEPVFNKQKETITPNELQKVNEKEQIKKYENSRAYIPGLTSSKDLERLLHGDDRRTKQSGHTHAASYTMSGASSDYTTMYFALLTVVGVLAVGVFGYACKRHREIQGHDGFVQVDTASCPEEKALAGMQMNGYENPTYQFFEAPTSC